MRGLSTTSALIVAASIIAIVVAALALLVVLRMAGGGVSSERGGQPAVSASVSLSEQDGVVTAMIQVRRGSLTGVAIKYAMHDGTIWWARPIYCFAADNAADVTTTGVYFSEPVPAGRTVRCAFYIWAPSTGAYDLWVIGYGPSGARSAAFAQSRLRLSANEYKGNVPAGTAASGANALNLPLKQSTAQYIVVPVNWRGVLVVQAQWGYTQYSSCSGPADGLYVSLFVTNYTEYDTKLVAPSDSGLNILPFGGADDTPAGSSLQLFVQFNPWDYGYYDGSIEFAVMNAAGGYGVVQPTNFNPSKYWPTSDWTTYVIYNATSNTLTVEWIVPALFDVKHAYDLNTFGSGAYRFTPPPPGQYYVVLGVASGWCLTDWRVYSYTVAAS